MEWCRERCLQLIDEYESHPVLWNPKHGLYYSKTKKCDAWVSIEENLGCLPGEAKKKMESILASFRREKAKRIKSLGTGKGTHEMYISKWFGFSRMMFLLDKDDPINVIDYVKVEAPDSESEKAFDDEDATNLQQEAESNTQNTEIIETAIEILQAPVASTSARTQKTNKRKRSIASSTPMEDTQVREAFEILKSAAASNSLKSDECGVYGQHVAHKLRSYTKRTKNIVQHHINMLLFNADMGKYDDVAESKCLSASNSNFSVLSPHPTTDFLENSNSFSPMKSEIQSTEHTPVHTPSPQSDTTLQNQLEF